MKNGQSFPESQLGEVFTRAAAPVLQLFCEVLRDEISTSLRESMTFPKTPQETKDMTLPENCYLVEVDLSRLEKAILVELHDGSAQSSVDLQDIFVSEYHSRPQISKAVASLVSSGLIVSAAIGRRTVYASTVVGRQIGVELYQRVEVV